MDDQTPDPTPNPAPELTAAVAAKHQHDLGIRCALCQERVPILETQPVVIAFRVAAGRILFRVAEPWCPGCADLMYGLAPYRHFDRTDF